MSFRMSEPRGMTSRGMQVLRTNSQKRQILLLLYLPHEEEGTRMKRGKEEYVGRGSCDWLEESKFPHPQSCLGHPKTTPSILHTFLELLHKPLELRGT